MQTRVLYLLAALAAAAPGPAVAQNCRKGVPCGNTCIAANRVCRVGQGTARRAPGADTTRTRPAPSTVTTTNTDPQPVKAPDAQSDASWVGSSADRIYFLASCAAAQDLAPANRRVFVTEQAALAAGFRRSRTPEC